MHHRDRHLIQTKEVGQSGQRRSLTSATIALPLPPSTATARQAEAAYLAKQGPTMNERYEKTMSDLQKERV